jgi:hypothetical protein
MQLETKSLRLKTAVTVGSYFGDCGCLRHRCGRRSNKASIVRDRGYNVSQQLPL